MPWWAILLQGVLFALLMGAAIAGLNRAQARAEQARTDPVMRYPWPIFAVGAAGALGFGAVAVLSQVYKNETSTWWVLALFLGFAGMGVCLMWEAALVRHRLGPDGLEHRSPFRGRSFVPWEDVTRLIYAPGMKWWVIDTPQRRVRVSVAMTGQPDFAAWVLDRVAPEAIDPDTAGVLRETAAGNPPNPFA